MFKTVRWTSWLILLVVLVFSTSPATFAQLINATLTGVVSDPSGAVVPNAKITLTNQISGDVRRGVSNTDGYFTFAAVPVGTYTVLVENPGFLKYESTGVVLGSSEKRNLDIVLQVGSSAEKVEVVAATDIVAPVDSGEKSSVLTTKQLQDFSVVGRSAAEFIKILPGMAISGTNAENRQNFTGETIGINGNGEGGSQSALNAAFAVNGLPTNSLDITADGAHVSDPGCNCATPVNPNTDMIQEFKVLTSNFSAENAKGPAVINTIAKAGGRDFHGQGYMYARHYAMNSNDWQNNRLGLKKPENKYLFPGGNIGGPVLIPGTNFNKNRDKLFFWSGYEYYKQTLDTGVLRATTPTEGMRNGIFTDAELSKIEGMVNGKPVTASGGPAQRPNSTVAPGGIIPASSIDKSGQGLMNIFPLPNADPNQTGGYNYVQQTIFDQNSHQWMSRVDYSVSDNTKLFVRYNMQREQQLFPVGLWWRNGNQVPYPTPVVGKNKSDSVSASLTHVFSPSLTNEFVFGYTYISFPNVFEDPSKVDRNQLGIPFKGAFKTGVAQIPAMTGWGGSEFATILNPSGFQLGGAKGLFADKYLPSISDNITKVWGTHTIKAGFFWEYVINNQPSNNYANGLIIEANWAGGSTGSAYADLLTGLAGQYQEHNKDVLHNEAYKVYEFFGQDAWKVSRRLTLEYGMRFSHMGPWYDREGFGFATWNPALYDPNASAAEYPGLTWHARDNSVPLSGFPGRTMFFTPRVGAAFDIFGTGNTVLRGGWGAFRYHNAQFTQGLDAPAGVQYINLTNLNSFSQIEALNPAKAAFGAGGVSYNDDQTPLTYSYSFTISQRMPGSSLLEAAYVGNKSKYGLNTNNIGTNVNAVPYGALLAPGVGDPNNANYDSFRPYHLYSDLNVANHNLYQNYNSMQVTWVRQKGRYNIQANYTLSKAMGIVTTTGDEFNIRNSYGPLPSDRRHIFNAAYSIELGSPVKGNAFAKGLINGWQLSGITQWQSGINLQPNSGNGNWNLQVNGFNNILGYDVSDRSINGTSSVGLRPLVTCNPSSNLKENQYVNGSCLALPTVPGFNGPTIGPEVFGPAFFNSDLSMFKNFQISESKKFQFRFQAYNFLNHPLPSFINNTSNLTANFNGTTGEQQNPVFGVATDKQGHRVIQLALKFYF